MYHFDRKAISVVQTDSLGGLVRLEPKPYGLSSILGSLVRLGPKLYYLVASTELHITNNPSSV